jgi:HNH endonuclease
MPPRYPREFLLQRALNRCEYCHFPEASLAVGLHVDHVIAQQHGGDDSLENLAMACAHCNFQKGPNVASVDPENRQIFRLFNPRSDVWAAHFVIAEDQILGLTPLGRATVNLLEFNIPINIEFRRHLRLMDSAVRP